MAVATFYERVTGGVFQETGLPSVYSALTGGWWDSAAALSQNLGVTISRSKMESPITMASGITEPIQLTSEMS